MKSRRGVAIILVLTFSTVLLVMGGWYIKMNTANRPVNLKVFEHAQADFLAQGLVQLAAMKFKKRPAEFYYAYKAMHYLGQNGPWTSYVTNDPTLNGTFFDVSGARYDFQTSWELIANNLYTEDGIRVTVTVTQVDAAGNAGLVRQTTQTLQATRRTL